MLVTVIWTNSQAILKNKNILLAGGEFYVM
jgi:hypothetical protein